MNFEFCPKCGNLMEYCVVYQDGNQHHFYMCPICAVEVPEKIGNEYGSIIG